MFDVTKPRCSSTSPALTAFLPVKLPAPRASHLSYCHDSKFLAVLHILYIKLAFVASNVKILCMSS
jgi:hypothetical protein